ncbi:phosphotransferase family protein [Flaviflexus huanghaiensis]|uniref:phosphotransferase family protein n=1 Tax=Flaviflexus huanghaiensis TaxID=1111473 RepID=UPI0015FDB054|nr:phosphotransferase [Flaviflexus huanghaiensis]
MTLPGLDDRQAMLAATWLPDAALMANLSWGLTDSTVLHVASRGEEFILKAGGPHNSHISREITAYETVVPALAARGHAPRMLHGDRSARILVLPHIPGALIDEGPLESDRDTVRQAGDILSTLHGMAKTVDDTIENGLVRAALRWLDKPNRILPRTAAIARSVLEAYEAGPATVVPSHGDYSGRNWIRSDKLVVIDFGRFGYRPARQDFLRLYVRRWHDHPAEREWFFDGYGEAGEAEGYRWWVDVLREAVATTGWAHKVGDRAFEEQGLRFIDVALAELE